MQNKTHRNITLPQGSQSPDKMLLIDLLKIQNEFIENEKFSELELLNDIIKKEINQITPSAISEIEKNLFQENKLKIERTFIFYKKLIKSTLAKNETLPNLYFQL